jgi:hypothetical protein
VAAQELLAAAGPGQLDGAAARIQRRRLPEIRRMQALQSAEARQGALLGHSGLLRQAALVASPLSGPLAAGCGAGGNDPCGRGWSMHCTAAGAEAKICQRQGALAAINTDAMVPNFDTIRPMRRKHQRTLELIFSRPVSGTLPWREIEALFQELGGEVSERAGSRVAVVLFDEVRVFHRPHPSPNADKGAVVSIRKWLQEHGVTP